MKKQNQTVQPRDPLFVSRCHPRDTVDYREIVEDSMPSRTIAVVGRCHTCYGIQRIVECAYNIDRIKLAQALHGNGNWLLDPKVVEGLRVKTDKPHGELANVSLPTTSRFNTPAPDRDFSEHQYDGSGGGPF